MNEGIKASRFHDKNVVVIGASRGLGRAIVAAAHAEGARVLAVARSAEPLKHAFEVVRRGGVVVSLPAQKEVGTLGEQLAPRYGVTFSLPLVHPSGEQMAAMVPLFEAGQLKTHLEAVFPLQDVAQAHKLIEGGHVRGKVVLTVE